MVAADRGTNFDRESVRVRPQRGLIGTVLSVLVGFGPGVALLAALTAMIMLPLLRVFHPPGVALAMCPALSHCGAWFAILVVLPFTLAAVISCAVLSRLVSSWPRYPAPF
jgi:HPP family